MQGLLLVLNSNCPNITFYQGSLEATQLTPSHPILLVTLWSNNIVTLTLQKRKPEFREVQIRARTWTQIFSFKSGTSSVWVPPLWEFAFCPGEHKCLGPALQETVQGNFHPNFVSPPLWLLFLVLPSFLFLSWVHIPPLQVTIQFHSLPRLFYPQLAQTWWVSSSFSCLILG